MRKKSPTKSILSVIFSIIQFIFTLPIKLGYFIVSTFSKAQQKGKERKLKKKRESIPAKYEDFTIKSTAKGSFFDFEKKLTSKNLIGIILGARGKGKTALGIKILENVRAKAEKGCFAMGFREDDLPAWIKVVEDVKDIENDSFVLIDEGGILFSSRKSMTDANQVLSDLILVSRHKNLSILFISQNSANLEINILRQADYLMLKPSSLLQKDFERKKIKELYEEITFDDYADEPGITYIYSDEFTGFVTNPLPSFWNLKISKSFK